jgi:hypothetical protein
MGLLPKDRTWAQHYTDLQHDTVSPLQGTVSLYHTLA